MANRTHLSNCDVPHEKQRLTGAGRACILLALPLTEQACMDTFEYIIAGGPKHGQVYRRPLDTRGSPPLVLITSDGKCCLPAAFKQAGAQLVLLHPEATGAQFRSILAA
jgi:hypothetical protein